jgi:hypothetical protein
MNSQNARRTTETTTITQIAAGDAVVCSAKSIADPLPAPSSTLRTYPESLSPHGARPGVGLPSTAADS